MERLKVEEIVDNNFSIKKMDRTKYINLTKSIKTYGQIKPIVVNEKNEILDGHILFKILKQLGYKDVWTVEVGTNGRSAEQVYLELNFLDHELDGFESFKYMTKIDLDDNCLPFNRKELEYFISLLSFNWEKMEDDEVPQLSFF